MTDKIELAKRAVACKGWRWMPGMRCLGCEVHMATAEDCAMARAGCLPDLDDPATLGCLIALVREVYDDHRIYTWSGMHPLVFWTVRGYRTSAVGTGETEVEALVAALESAP